MAGGLTIRCTPTVLQPPAVQQRHQHLGHQRTDKLNSYRKYGNDAVLSNESKRGVFKVGFWYEWANTDRFQTPTDPRTYIDLLTANFHEKFVTQSAQPFAQYEYRVTKKSDCFGRLKLSDYDVQLNQFADNGKTIGCIGGK